MANQEVVIRKHYESGDKYVRLMLTGKCYISEKGLRFVETICDCGNVKWVHLSGLRSGHTQTCGCKQKDSVRNRQTTHGMSIAGKRHPLYEVWANMIQRCTNKNNERFNNYGGRGILVFEQWKEFLPFYKWAIVNGWEEGLEIDREDNDGNYCPENCWFTTTAVQNRNRRNNVIIEAFGEKKCAMDWQHDVRCSVLRQTIVNRMNQGISAELSIAKPPYKRVANA